VVLTAAGTSSYLAGPMSASEARGKIRASTSAMRQPHSDWAQWTVSAMRSSVSRCGAG
jgi:hypothetical protein